MGCASSTQAAEAPARSPPPAAAKPPPKPPANAVTPNGRGAEVGDEEKWRPTGSGNLGTPKGSMPVNPKMSSDSHNKEEMADANAKSYTARNLMRLNSWKTNLHADYDMDMGRPLGKGSFGTVRLAHNRETGKEFAIKCFVKAEMDKQDLEDLEVEVNAMRLLGKSLNSLSLHGQYEDATHFYVVMELCTGGELYKRIKEGEYTENFVAHIAKNVVQFIAQCHVRHVVFRDVKPDNFLFLNSDDDSPLKATDFGLACYHNSNQGEPLFEMTGTPYYMAPEVIKQNYGQEADMWSVGVMVYQLLCGRLPYPGPPLDSGLPAKKRTLEIFRSIMCAYPIDFSAAPWPQVSAAALDFVKQCLAYEPVDRLTAAKALNHPWLKLDQGVTKVPLQGTVVQRLQRFSSYGILKQKLLKKITLKVLNMDDHEVKNILNIFKKMDTDGSGTLSTSELLDGLTASGYHIQPSEMEKLANAIDDDKSGEVDYEEFIAALLEWKVQAKSSEWNAAAEQVFGELDRDKSGFIDGEEIAHLIDSSPDDPKIWDCIVEADEDGDGKVTLDEFIRLVQPIESDDLKIWDRRLTGSRRPSMKVLLEKDEKAIEQILFSASSAYQRKQKARVKTAANAFKQNVERAKSPRPGGSSRPASASASGAMASVVAAARAPSPAPTEDAAVSSHKIMNL